MDILDTCITLEIGGHIRHAYRAEDELVMDCIRVVCYNRDRKERDVDNMLLFGWSLLKSGTI